MNAIFLDIIFTLMFAACIIMSIVLAFKRKGFFWLTAYIILSIAAETTRMWFIPYGVFNHYMYAAGMTTTSFAIFMYYANTLKTRTAYLLYGSFFAVILSFYVMDKMWEPFLLIPQYYITSYNTIMAISTTYFLWHIIAQEKMNIPSKPLWFGGMFIVLFTVRVFSESFLFGGCTDDPIYSRILAIYHVVDYSFEISKFIILTWLLMQKDK